MSSLRRENMIVEFQKRRKRMMMNFIFCLVLIALSLVIAQIGDSFPGLFGIGKRGWSALSAAQFVTGVVFAIIGLLQYRCPSCHEILRGHDRYYFGVLIDPDKCPNCGTRLRED
jgi:hypothetical protein